MFQSPHNMKQQGPKRLVTSIKLKFPKIRITFIHDWNFYPENAFQSKKWTTPGKSSSL